MANAERNEYRPDEVSPPGASLLDTLESLGMTQADLAARMGRPKKTINEIIKGKAVITAQTALQLEKVLGVPASFWTNRERVYQEYLARRKDDSTLATFAAWAKRYPIAEMAKRQWIPAVVDSLGQARELLRFFGIAAPAQLEAAFGDIRFRKSPKSRLEPLQVWLRRGVIQAQEMVCEPFDAEKFEAVLAQARGWTLLAQEDFQQRVVAECAKAGVAVVIVPELPGCGVHGATRWLLPTRALLQLCLFRKSHDQLVFTFFHEAEHILRHNKKQTFVETGKLDKDPEEIDANQRAAERLIPQAALNAFLKEHRGRVSSASVKQFAASIGICPGIVVGRLQHDAVIPFAHLNQIKRPLCWVNTPPTDGQGTGG
jgi:HTH-type transcriptional regulator / antitoxin HigA